jgi:hypothetical protein
MALAPTLATIEALYRKVEREAYRAFHAQSPLHKADHFYNFCVTAHSLRDYFFKRKGIVGKPAKKPYHQLWDKNPALLAAGEIANSSKHFTLRWPPQTRGVRAIKSGFMNIYQAQSGSLSEVPVRAPDISVRLSDGKRLKLYQFTEDILHYWKAYLGAEGIRIRRQPFRQLSGPPD